MRLNRFRLKAKLEKRGAYREKPQYAFNYKYKYKHVDTNLPVTTWASMWLKQTWVNILDYLLDLIVRRNTNAVMFKTAGFTKR